MPEAAAAARAPPVWVWLACGAAATLLFALWLQGLWGGELGVLWMESLALVAVPALAAAGAWGAARRWDARGLGVQARAWRLLALACAAWSAASLVVAWVFLVAQRGVSVPERTIAVPGLADVGFLVFFPLAITGLVRLPQGTFDAPSKMRMAFDALFIAACVVFAVLASGVADNIATLGSDALRPDLCAALDGACDEAGIAFGLANPLGDVLLACAALLCASLANRIERSTTFALAGGFVAITIADVDFSTRWLRSDSSLGNLLDTGWVLGFLLVAYAAHRSARTPSTSPAAHRGRDLATALVPYVPLVGAVLSAQGSEIRTDVPGKPLALAVTAGLVLGLLFSRQALVVLENQRLNRELRAEHGKRMQLLNNIAHDLMGPLSPVRIQASLLAGGLGPLNEPQAKSVAILGRNVDQAIRLTTDLKDLATMQGGQFRLDLAPTDLAALARLVADTFTAQASQKGVTVRVEATPGLVVQGDGVRLTQVLTNLVGNALKFTTQGSVVVRLVDVPAAGRQGRLARVEVVDSGRGLAPADAAKLFSPFVQVHDRKAMAPHERGTGLGLFICKGIVEQHGGTVGVHSPGPGQGSTFWFAIPQAPGATASVP